MLLAQSHAALQEAEAAVTRGTKSHQDIQDLIETLKSESMANLLSILLAFVTYSLTNHSLSRLS